MNEEKEVKKPIFYIEPNKYSSVKKVIGVVSGKGGVGKSLVTSMLAATFSAKGHRVGILDADITGPSIPKAFGLSGKAVATDHGIIPMETDSGISVMSINLVLGNDTDPVLWRGPMITGAVKQFWQEVIWDSVDYLFVDMPPGTGDVPLTVYQSLPLDGIVVVTSPQDLVSMIVTKAIKMAKMMKVEVLGLIENMSYFTCPDNGVRYNIFGESKLGEIASEYNLDIIAELPIDPEIAKLVDSGRVEEYKNEAFDLAYEKLIDKMEK